MHAVSIVGAAGYTGQETLDRVLGHPQLDLVAVGSDSLAGQPGAAPRPPARPRRGAGVRDERGRARARADVTILCLSHEAAAAIDGPPDGVVVDLSGAHRLRDASSYEAWYGFRHPRPESLADWVYGLPELVAEAGRLIANPGCYATAALLALAPLRDAIEPGSVVVDGLSGMTGAGRTLRPSSHAGSVLENVSPYRVGAHQHVPEIAQLLGFPVSFTPHLLPRPARPDRDLQRPLHGPTCGRCSRPPMPAARSSRCCRRGRRPSSRGCSTRTGPRSASSRPLHRSDGRDLRRGQSRQGRRRARRSRTSIARSGSRRHHRAPARRGAGLGMSVTAAQGFVASGVSAGIRPSGKPDVAVVRSRAPLGRCGGLDDEPRPGRPGHGLEASSRDGRSRRRC